jgi:5-methylcytosine-specific restriction endonuclease McrA
MKAYHRRKDPKTRRFSGEYAEDGKAKRLAIREEDGHRCIRCGHPFESGKHGKGEWSPCDDECKHRGPFRFRALETEEWDEESHADPYCPFSPITGELVELYYIEARWRILTVHHLDGDKSNDAWFNTLSLCQRCHLQIQTRVDPRIPWFLEHSAWFKPYAAGYYAFKYEGKLITREEAMERMDELLAYELRAQ